MTVLVDEARWEWRGTHWAHLVSDHSTDELHAFAQALGKRRVGFQGDHYDIDVVDRDRALAAGATAVASRELVRRLRASGLRDRHAKPQWWEQGSWPSGMVVHGLPSTLARPLDMLEVDSTAARVVWLGDPRRDALVLDFDLAVEVTSLVAPHATGRRADGSWSIELFAPSDPARGD